MLGVHRKSTNAAVTAELGSFPILIEQLCGAVKYWLHLQGSNQDNLVYKCLLENYTLCRIGKPCWLVHIKHILNFASMQETWCNVSGAQPHTVTHKLRQQKLFMKLNGMSKSMEMSLILISYVHTVHSSIKLNWKTT